MKNKLSRLLAPLAYGVMLAQAPPDVNQINWPRGTYTTLTDLVNGVGTYLFGFISAFAVFAIIYSGIMYITASGDTAKSDTAKKNLTWAITGLVIALMAWYIVRRIISVRI